MDTKFREIFESFIPPHGKCGFYTELTDIDGRAHKCKVRYNRVVTDKMITITDIRVFCSCQDVTDFEAIQNQIKSIEARCMTHAEQDREYAETLLQTFQS